MHYEMSIWSRVRWPSRRPPLTSVRTWTFRESMLLCLRSTAVFGLPTLALFTFWMAGVSARGGVGQDLEWQIWLGGSWTFLAALLIPVWEARVGTVLACIQSAPPAEGWEVARAQARLDLLTRWRAALCATVAVAVLGGYLANLELFHEVAGAPSVEQPLLFAASIVTVIYLGLSFGMGFWGVATTIVLVLTLVTGDVAWEPFSAAQPDGVDRLVSLSFLAGFLFSVGNVFTPVVIYILRTIHGVGLMIGSLILAGLLLGGLAVFVIPALHVAAVAHRRKGALLGRLREQFTAAWALALRGDGRQDWAELESRVNVLVSLRGVVTDSTAMPLGLYALQRASVLLVVPGLGVLIEVILGN